jgi:hypothetical protein
MSQRCKRANQEWHEEGLDMNQWLYEIEQSQLSTAANNVEVAGNGTIQIVWAW